MVEILKIGDGNMLVDISDIKNDKDSNRAK